MRRAGGGRRRRRRARRSRRTAPTPRLRRPRAACPTRRRARRRSRRTVGAHGSGDAHRQRARGQLVVGEQHECPPDRRDECVVGVGREHGATWGVVATGRGRRRRPASTAGNIVRIRRAAVAGSSPAWPMPSGRGDDGKAVEPFESWSEAGDASVQRRTASVSGAGQQSVRRQRAGPQQLGDLLELADPASSATSGRDTSVLPRRAA